ncbi:MAG TPA: PQQ-binding-like beta-propeller repeat protein, partial [Actinopolymorphaceae bacterium]
VPGSHVYAPARQVGADVLLIDEWGVAQLVDSATGQPRWRAELPDRNRVLNAGPVVAGDTAWVVSATGLLASIDLESGALGHYRQLGSAQTFSTPVIAEGMLLTGGQDGTLQAIALPGGRPG